MSYLSNSCSNSNYYPNGSTMCHICSKNSLPDSSWLASQIHKALVLFSWLPLASTRPSIAPNLHRSILCWLSKSPSSPSAPFLWFVRVRCFEITVACSSYWGEGTYHWLTQGLRGFGTSLPFLVRSDRWGLLKVYCFGGCPWKPQFLASAGSGRFEQGAEFKFIFEFRWWDRLVTSLRALSCQLETLVWCQSAESLLLMRLYRLDLRTYLYWIAYNFDFQNLLASLGYFELLVACSILIL